MKKRRLTLLCLLLALAAGALWYARPMGIYELYPGMEADLISVHLMAVDQALEMESRDLRLSAGDPGFEALLARVEELRFRRPPTDVLLLVLPALGNAFSSSTKTLEAGDIQHLYIDLAQDIGREPWRSGELSLWVDQWTYRDFDRGVSLPLSLAGGRDASQALARELWDMAPPDA